CTSPSVTSRSGLHRRPRVRLYRCFLPMRVVLGPFRAPFAPPGPGNRERKRQLHGRVP
ncbi:MAG: hypothetical protein AVDCRST_MAG56-2796, partial [uncultured Cytophagales bacterium]